MASEAVDNDVKRKQSGISDRERKQSSLTTNFLFLTPYANEHLDEYEIRRRMCMGKSAEQSTAIVWREEWKKYVLFVSLASQTI